MGNVCVFLTAVLSFLMQVSGGPSSYRAAVVEYHPSAHPSEAERVEANVKNYVKFMTEAKSKGADIIVFPEGGLGTKETRSYVPDPAEKVVPCDTPDAKFTKVIKDLSCASKTHSIYSVVNLVERRDCAPDDEHCPPKRYYVFNTNVVFDRRGTVIARYAKYNLFDEPFTDITQDPEMIFFDTDFGVRFGTFICFDILFAAPAQRLIQQYHITDFVFTTHWFGELPFLTALQAQGGWAETNNVNLLASGVNDPMKGSGGSGIYNGKFGPLVQIMTEKVTSKLLVADVPKFSESCGSDVSWKTDSAAIKSGRRSTTSKRAIDNSSAAVEDEAGLTLLHDQIRFYNSEVVEKGKKFDKTLCSHDNNLCCHFEVTVDALLPPSENYTLRALVFNGVRKFGQTFTGGVQACGVVLCNGPDINNCTNQLRDIWGLFKFKKIHIKGNFNLRNSFQMPSTLTVGDELKPLSANKYVFKRTETDVAEVSLELVWPAVDLQTFAIWGRDFTRDREPNVPESGTSKLGLPFLFFPVVAFLLFLR